MKAIVIFIVLLSSVVCRAQPLMMDGQGIDTITIKGYVSAYLFTKDHAGYSRVDTLRIIYDKSHNNYVVYRYSSQESHYSDIEKNRWDKINKHEEILGTVIHKDMLDSLMLSLSVRVVKPTVEQMGISDADLKKYLNEERIREEIQKHSWPAYWRHNKKKLTRERSPKLFDAFNSIDTLRAYMVSIAIDTSNTLSFSDDYSDGIHIYISAGPYRYYYYTQPREFKQPWHDEPQNAPMPGRKYTYMYSRTPIFNYAINRYLLAILPKDYVHISQMRNEDLMENYLSWFIRHQGFTTIKK